MSGMLSAYQIVYRCRTSTSNVKLKPKKKTIETLINILRAGIHSIYSRHVITLKKKWLKQKVAQKMDNEIEIERQFFR